MKSLKVISFIFKQYKDIKSYGIKELIRKLILTLKILINFPLFGVGIFMCIIIRLLSPFFIIRIARAPCSNFGNFTADMAIYCAKKQLNVDQLQKKHLDFFYILPSSKIYNRQLEKMWKREVFFLSGYFLWPVDCINKIIPGWRKHSIKGLSYNIERDKNNLIEQYQPPKFTNEEEVRGKELLKKFGLTENDKFVCLSIRDKSYELKKISSRFRDWSYQEHRNYNIDDFQVAAESLAKKGYYVFRMGNVVEKKFKSQNSKLIDYANSEFKSDFMDIYLGSKCSFCISTCNGFLELAYIFKKPIALLHLPVGDFPSHSKKYLLMTKNHRLKKEKRNLSLSEIFSYGVALAFDSKTYKEKGIELVDFTPQEIRDFALEMEESITSEKKPSQENEELQKKFKLLFASNIESYKKGKDITYLLHDKIRSRISVEFINKNKNWLR